MTENQGTMAKFIVVFNDKGGAGKTTTACNLAGTLGLRGYDVLVADLCQSKASEMWLSAEGGQNIKATIWPGHRYGAGVSNEFQKLAKKYEIIVVDCAPIADNPSTWASLLVADMAIIPTKLMPTDFNALPAAKRLARRAQEASGRQFPCFVLPIALRANLADHQAIITSLMEDKEFPILMGKEQVKVPTKKGSKTVEKEVPLALGERVAFTRAMLAGSTPHSLPKANQAVDEIEAVADLCLTAINLPSTRGE